MDRLLNLKKDDKIEIDGKQYQVEAKTSYMTMSSTDVYYKYILSGHNILVVIPTDDMIYLGQVVEEFEQGMTFSNTICYNGYDFEQVASGYQVVKCVEYGNPQEVEGEVLWADYQNESLEDIYISCAWVYKTNKRADIVGKIIDAKSVVIK